MTFHRPRVAGQQTWLPWLLMIVAGGLGVQLIFENVSKDSPVRQLAAATLTGQVPPAAAVLGPIDSTLARLPSGGNLLFQFVGFDADDPGAQRYVSFVYYRSSYLLYPRRVYLGPSDRVVNNGEQILATGFEPANSWLVSHDVRWVIRFLFEKTGVRVDVLPAQSTITDGQNKRP